MLIELLHYFVIWRINVQCDWLGRFVSKSFFAKAMLGLILLFRLSVSRLSMKLNKNLLSLGKFFCIH